MTIPALPLLTLVKLSKRQLPSYGYGSFWLCVLFKDVAFYFVQAKVVCCVYKIFTELAHWADSVIELQCPSVCVSVCPLPVKLISGPFYPHLQKS